MVETRYKSSGPVYEYGTRGVAKPSVIKGGQSTNDRPSTGVTPGPIEPLGGRPASPSSASLIRRGSSWK